MSGDRGLARQEPNIRASARTELDADGLFSINRRGEPPADRERQEAIACVLSASDGWDSALRRLGGTFASTGLRVRKAD